MATKFVIIFEPYKSGIQLPIGVADTRQQAEQYIENHYSRDWMDSTEYKIYKTNYIGEDNNGIKS